MSELIAAHLWDFEFETRAKSHPNGKRATIALAREDGTCFHYFFHLFPHEGAMRTENEKYVSRTLKTLFWIKGGSRVHLHADVDLISHLSSVYSSTGARNFDADFMGLKLCGEPLSFIHHESADSLPEPKSEANPLGRHLDGCRIGFDLGGSDRKTAAVIDGEVVFSEEVPWDPYFQSDPSYHLEGIRHSLKRAAEHLPRVDAIGGSAAGNYFNNTVRVASLFRGVTDEAIYENEVRPMFLKLKEEWGGVPFDVINDGDVTALAAAMNFDIHSVLGIAMGTSMAVGYCDPQGELTPGINELAFAPIDDHPEAAIDEWSGHRGCGVQYFSQQAVARHAKNLGLDYGAMPFPEQLIEVQKLMKLGDSKVAKIFSDIGSDLGHAIKHYSRFYEIDNLLILGRVTSGEGGQVILDNATTTMASHYPELHERITFVTPDETMKRHGQAIAAASLPRLV
jgi:predicted NBD/HSP70 family sugar kinase